MRAAVHKGTSQRRRGAECRGRGHRERQHEEQRQQAGTKARAETMKLVWTSPCACARSHAAYDAKHRTVSAKGS